MPVKDDWGRGQVEAGQRSVKGRGVEQIGAKGGQRSGKDRVEVRSGVSGDQAAELS